MDELAGGRVGQIFRNEDTVVRPAGPWTKTVHRFLTYIRNKGMRGVPSPLGMNSNGQEVLSFVSGRVARSLVDPEVSTDAVVISAARLLRHLHQASQGFLETDTDERHWMLSARDPQELVCHGDFAPYNVTIEKGEATGLIDFDTAHPAYRMWDFAYGLYRWAPLSDPTNEGVPFNLKEQLRRASLFCSSYRIDVREAATLPNVIAERLRVLCEFIELRADAGDEVFVDNIRSGHVSLYRRDIAYVQSHSQTLVASLLAAA